MRHRARRSRASARPVGRKEPQRDELGGRFTLAYLEASRADTVNVLYWSHLGKWSQIGDFGGITLPLDEALAYVAENGIFWTGV